VGRRGSSKRAAALREQQVEAALADYFEACGEAERVRVDARRKADAMLDSAEQAAAVPASAARDAARRLRELTGSNAEVAGLCGLTVAAVREMLTGPEPRDPAAGPERPGAG
jgi:hypothetical protein